MKALTVLFSLSYVCFLNFFLDIYASSSGIAHCLHLLTLLNNEFKKFTSVDNMSIEYIHDKDRDSTDAIVR